MAFRVVGDGFLRNMVRILAGTLAWIGQGRIEKPLSEILEAKDREEAGITAPAYGLCMDWVSYDPYEERLSCRHE